MLTRFQQAILDKLVQCVATWCGSGVRYLSTPPGDLFGQLEGFTLRYK